MKKWKTVGRKLLKAAAFAVMAVTVFVGGFMTNEMLHEHTATDIAPLEKFSIGGGMQIGGIEEKGVELMSTNIALADYEEYGVSATAESAQLLTATVTPSDSANHGIDWTIAWASSSTWASGKTVTDYITVVPTTSGATTATVSCLLPFGTKAIITATSQDNPNVKATCTVDYAQKVTSATLNFGNVAINLGDDTAIKYEIAEGVQGPGGKVEAEIQKSSVYTISENFQYSVQFSRHNPDIELDLFSCNGLAVTGAGNVHINTEYYGEEIYFDYDHDIKNWFIMQRSGDIYFKDLTTMEIGEYLSNITYPGLYTVNFTITGAYSSYTYNSKLQCTGYTDNTPVNAVSLSSTNFIF